MLMDSFQARNLSKTLDYLEVFARFKDEENIKAVERLLNSHTELEMFERSQLGMFRLHTWQIQLLIQEQGVCAATMRKKPNR